MKLGKFKRREFIKISSAFLASSAVAHSGSQFLSAESAEASVKSGDRVVKSICEICFWRCGIDVHVRDEKVYKITGQKDHPLSRGRLCPRGAGGHGLLYDPDRLKHPLIREIVNGRQFFRKASWEEAMTLVADNVKQLGQDYGPGALVSFTHGFGASFLKRLCNSCGIVSAPSYAQCRGAREDGFKLTYGHSVGSPEGVDVANCKYLVVIGHHLGENMHNTAVQDLSLAIKKGAKLVAVDPRFSVLASKGKWLPIKPATDIALVRGWIHILIKEKKYNIDFVAQNTVGIDELWDGVKDATPELTAKLTGIPVEQVVEVARDLARYAPNALIHPGRRANWYGDDTQRARSMAILNALLGNYKMPGGLITQKKYGVPPINFPKFKHPRVQYSSKYPLASKVSSFEIIQHTLEGKPWDIHGWIVYGTNLIHTSANQALTYEAITKLKFIASIDVLPSEITGYSDVILPECTYLERYDDLDDRTYREPYVAIRQPAVPPMYDSKPGIEIFKILAEKMGRFDLFEDDIETYLDKRLKKIGKSLEELKEKGVFVKPETPLYRQPNQKLKFKTPSGKIELVSSKMKEHGFDGVPQYTPHRENPDGYYRLLFGRAPMHSFGRTTNNRILLEMMPENTIWVNEQAAERIGLKDGEYVYLVHENGTRSNNNIKVKLTQRVRDDVVYMVHGFGHTDPRLRAGYMKGVNSSELTIDTVIDPVMGAVGIQHNFVTFSRGA
ncbi:MAG: molybdopterin-dependent oxidoreductase [Deltaproteobacteria bacterium]|jgi:thiosulfate reductase / polysulfide reductase chain A|nr:molybdopterin-dependent oxidoreductase [Deltaproteobacteria bacterium]